MAHAGQLHAPAHGRRPPTSGRAAAAGARPSPYRDLCCTARSTPRPGWCCCGNRKPGGAGWSLLDLTVRADELGALACNGAAHGCALGFRSGTSQPRRSPTTIRQRVSRGGSGLGILGFEVMAWASFQLLHRASRVPRRMKRVCNSAATSGAKVGSYTVLRARISVGPAASRAPRTVAWGFLPLSTHFKLR